MTSAKPLYEVIDLPWARALAPVEPTVHEIGERLHQEMAPGVGYLSTGTGVLRAFTYSMEDVRVLIVGQNPYPIPGRSMELSFSVAPGVKPPRSLENIFRKLVNDLGVPRPASRDLTPWCQQGVMLLNRVLTVRLGTPVSHKGWGWEKVTQRAIEALMERGGLLVAILQGRSAQSLTPMSGQTPIIAPPHPSPLSALRGFFGSRPSSHANAIPTEMGTAPMDWCLP